MDMIFAIFFSIELLLNFLAYGIIGYLKCRWNLLDFCIIFATII